MLALPFQTSLGSACLSRQRGPWPVVEKTDQVLSWLAIYGYPVDRPASTDLWQDAEMFIDKDLELLDKVLRSSQSNMGIVNTSVSCEVYGTVTIDDAPPKVRGIGHQVASFQGHAFTFSDAVAMKPVPDMFRPKCRPDIDLVRLSPIGIDFLLEKFFVRFKKIKKSLDVFTVFAYKINDYKRIIFVLAFFNTQATICCDQAGPVMGFH